MKQEVEEVEEEEVEVEEEEEEEAALRNYGMIKHNLRTP